MTCLVPSNSDSMNSIFPTSNLSQFASYILKKKLKLGEFLHLDLWRSVAFDSVGVYVGAWFF